MDQTYEGPLEPGALFRYLSGDIHCRVLGVEGGWVKIQTLDCEGYSLTPQAYRIQAFRERWAPERRWRGRW